METRSKDSVDGINTSILMDTYEALRCLEPVEEISSRVLGHTDVDETWFMERNLGETKQSLNILYTLLHDPRAVLTTLELTVEGDAELLYASLIRDQIDTACEKFECGLQTVEERPEEEMHFPWVSQLSWGDYPEFLRDYHSRLRVLRESIHDEY